MITSDRDARRADVRGIRSHLAAIDRRLVASEGRTPKFEECLLHALTLMGSKLETVDLRVSAIEQRLGDQAG
ncbi:MAG: hypothetical protein FJZ00_11910 [Candidatus Sericytochromatia bacterium]|uniref:Uncharacterized protein n=1 Tax=Candidatus Tanganyikabacteria bacterium TaxID=2961651 RepID=A0A938BK14_9BACT|nr:hypothetical protein [Candidatus Tanganyikabacteria bacterium]